MSKLGSWIYAFRLRTLPLALSSIITGGSIAFAENRVGFKWLVFSLCIITTLLLQILSNLANDYGDSKKGTDNAGRIGPVRAVQAGFLSLNEMRGGIIVFVGLCLFSGIWLIIEATKGLNLGYGIFFFALGIAAIAAAVKYTVGKDAYGYSGFGDLFVFLFFGIVGVCGSYYLLAHLLHYAVLLPAITIGAFAAGVLNLNNMRDAQSDKDAGKNTLVVKIGIRRAKIHQAGLIVIGFITAIAFMFVNLTSSMQFLFIITIPLFRKHLASVRKTENPADFDPQLKLLALSTFFFSLLFAMGVIIGAMG